MDVYQEMAKGGPPGSSKRSRNKFHELNNIGLELPIVLQKRQETRNLYNREGLAASVSICLL